MRRLLENGANTSFVNRILDQALPIDQIIANPTHKLRHCSPRYHPLIPLPGDLFGAERKNARGIDLSDPMVSAPLLASIERELKPAPPKEEGSRSPAEVEIVNPAHLEQVVGAGYEWLPWHNQCHNPAPPTPQKTKTRTMIAKTAFIQGFVAPARMFSMTAIEHL